MTLLKLGVVKIDITPKHSIPLAGFALRKELGPFEGVSHRIYARIFYFQTQNKQGRVQESLLVSADLIWWGSERVPILKRQIRDQYGIDEDYIILHATHTHSGPQTSNRFTKLLGEHDELYIHQLETSLLEGIATAKVNMEPVSIEKGNGQCKIGINRRNQINQKQELSPNSEGPNDSTVTVLHFRKESGSTKALLVHFTCHPVTTKDNLISSEFCGVAMDLIEKQIGEDVVSAYLQGFCGDINPGQNGQFSFGSNERVQHLGEVLTKETMAIISRPMTPLTVEVIVSRKLEINLPLKKLPNKEELESLKDRPDIMGEWSQLLLAAPDRMASSIPLSITYLQLAGEFSLLATNCEVVVEYCLFLKKNFADKVLPLGYSNGMFGYLPTAAQLMEGGYESYDSTFYFGLPAPFDTEVEKKVTDAIVHIISNEP